MPWTQKGAILAGKYRVERALGRGGMGIVLEATHLDLDDRVAIKLLHPELCGDWDAVERFIREGWATRRLRSDHVVRVTDAGRLELGVPFLVLELLRGCDLSTWLKTRGALPPSDAARLLVQACDAVGEAHMLGLVHRDLKPANLFLVDRGTLPPIVKVLDFGVAKVLDRGDSLGLTQTLMMLGSPAYMSPEQLRSSRRVDARTDIWALGIILFQLLTGKRPFTGTDRVAVIAAIMLEPAESLRDHLPEAPQALVYVVERCLQKDPARRFPNVAELVDAMAPVAPEDARRVLTRLAPGAARTA